MKKVILHGHLRKFGKRFDLDVASPAEAVRALCVLCRGFRQHLEKYSEPGYRIIVGKTDRDAEELSWNTSEETIRIVPVVAGAGPVGRIIIGAAIIGAAFYTGGASIAAGGFWSAGITTTFWGGMSVGLGASLVLGGVSEMLFSTKQGGTTESPDNKPSYVFSGAVNTVGQGNPVPVLYGRMRVGSQVISTGISTEQIAI
jgi:predicted phage tail protein